MSDSPKSRGNYGTGGWCPRTECANRDKRCGKCVKVRGEYSEYKAQRVR